MATSADRRKRKRLAVHWPVRLVQPGRPWVVSTTENLSSDGLYCISKEPFKLGDRLQCEIIIPGDSFGAAEAPVRLQCQVTVSRVEHLSIVGAFGLGCHIEDYALVTGSPPPDVRS